MRKLIIQTIRREGLTNILFMYESISEYCEVEWGLSPYQADVIECWFDRQ